MIIYIEKMEKTEFEFEEAMRLYDESRVIKVGNREYKLISDKCKEYISKYFYCTNDDNYYYWDAINQNMKSYNYESFIRVFFNRLPNEINKWFFKENRKIYNVICETKKPRIEGKNFNVFEGLMHEKRKYEEHSEEAKKGVELMISYMKKILANNDDKILQYILLWLSNMCKGNKNDSILYLKGIEGIGKSTLSTFLMNYVIGPKISMLAGAKILKGSYNNSLCGKLLVIFEELESFSVYDWEGASSTLKKMVTEEYMLYEEKYVRQFLAKNINNYIINSNNEIRNSDGRRIFIVPISTIHKGDTEFFGKLKKGCYNNDVGSAFYNRLIEMNTDEFYAQNFPETEAKNDAIVERLDYVYRFLKDTYILKNESLNGTVKEVYEEYVQYMKNINKTYLSKYKFSSKLKEINIDHYKSDSNNKYKVSSEDLKEKAIKNKWIHQLDEFTEVNKVQCLFDDNDPSPKGDKGLDYGIQPLFKDEKDIDEDYDIPDPDPKQETGIIVFLNYNVFVEKKQDTETEKVTEKVTEKLTEKVTEKVSQYDQCIFDEGYQELDLQEAKCLLFDALDIIN
jgi:hypothetical protein